MCDEKQFLFVTDQSYGKLVVIVNISTFLSHERMNESIHAFLTFVKPFPREFLIFSVRRVCVSILRGKEGQAYGQNIYP